MSEHSNNDLLSSVLSTYQLRAGVDAHPQLCGVWQMAPPARRRAGFHFVGSGHCWLHLRDADPQPLEGGDLIILPHDDWHMLSSAPQIAGDGQWMHPEAEGPFTTLVCGYFEFVSGGRNPLLDALPALILVRGRNAGSDLQQIGRMLVAEAGGDALGTQIVLDKLADVLFVMAVRHHIRQRADQRGLLAALADARLCKALSAMHAQPGEPWTLETLAQTAGMSRSSFAQRFTELVEVSPIEYLTRWRMTRAELMLRNPRASVTRVAGELGYETEAAFRRAYKRVHGVGPGAVRRWARHLLEPQ